MTDRTMVWTLRTQNGRTFGGSVASKPSATGQKGRFDPSSRLLALQYKSELKAKGQLKLTFWNFDLEYFNSPVLMKGLAFDFSFGYPGDSTEIVTVRVSGISGFEKIVITADAIENNLDFVKREIPYGNVSRAEIARLIADRNGFKKRNIKDTFDRDDYSQNAETDREFMMRLGDEIGFKFFTRFENGESVFHFHRRDLNQRPVQAFTWRGGQGNLKKFNIKENSILGRPSKVVIKGADVEERKAVEGTSTTGANPYTLGTADETAAAKIDTEFGEITIENNGALDLLPTEELLPRPHESEKKATAEAEAILADDKEDVIKATATVVGNPQLKMQQIVWIDGMPKMLTGNYLIEALTHKIGTGGYTTEMNLKRDAHSDLPVAPDGKIASGGRLNAKIPRKGRDLMQIIRPAEFGEIEKVTIFGKEEEGR